MLCRRCSIGSPPSRDVASAENLLRRTALPAELPVDVLAEPADAVRQALIARLHIHYDALLELRLDPRSGRASLRLEGKKLFERRLRALAPDGPVTLRVPAELDYMDITVTQVAH